MTRVDFYFNVADKLHLLSDLVQQALDKRHQVTILVADEHAATALSVALWQSQASSFLPNVLVTDTLAIKSPVVVDWHEKQLYHDDILINLTQQQPNTFSRFRQLLELVGNEAQDKVAARLRYKFYRDRGYDIKHTDQIANLIN